LAAAIEEHHDEKGIKWPEALAPFQVELITINQKDEATRAAADKLYEELTAAGKEVLYDDRDVSAGNKLGDAELMGMPTRIVISEKTLANNQVEVSNRSTGEVKMVKIEEIFSAVA
jgi:prolyl-tRNA synthetase